VDIDGATLTVRAIGADGGEIERYALQPRPVIAPGGVLASGTYSPTLVPGSPASIFGRNLAVNPETPAGAPLPLRLGGIRVQLDDRDIPLLYVSPGQVNVQIPHDARAAASLQVVTPNGSAQTQISLA
jgi:uncharacterized protein (TIGR03437 family)